MDVYGNVPVESNCPIPNAHWQLDISHLPDGVYFVRVYQGADFVTEKLIKVSR